MYKYWILILKLSNLSITPGTVGRFAIFASNSSSVRWSSIVSGPRHFVATNVTINIIIRSHCQNCNVYWATAIFAREAGLVIHSSFDIDLFRLKRKNRFLHSSETSKVSHLNFRNFYTSNYKWRKRLWNFCSISKKFLILLRPNVFGFQKLKKVIKDFKKTVNIFFRFREFFSP